MNQAPVTNLPGVARTIVGAGLLSVEDASTLLAKAQTSNRTFVRELLDSGQVEDATLAPLLSKIFSVPYLNIDAVEPLRLPPKIIAPKLMRTRQVVGLRVARNKSLIAACSDPSDDRMVQVVQFSTQMKLDLVLVESGKLKAFLTKLLTNEGGMDALDDDEAQQGEGLNFWSDFEAKDEGEAT